MLQQCGWRQSARHACVQVRVLRGDPADVSYWMMRNIPLSAAARHELLGAPTVVHRLRGLRGILAAEARSQLLCAVCRCQVALKACRAASVWPGMLSLSARCPAARGHRAYTWDCVMAS